MDMAPETVAAKDDAALIDYIADQEKKSFLRFLTCGSVDDGKSTLIGRLLFDTKLIFEDQLAALEKDSARHGTVGDDIDLALLVDGLEAEREQGITIDVAYRFFATDKRKFIVADTPGHEQYTRNMATGASTADLAVLLVDARSGIIAQTKRHSFIASLLGIRHVVLAINKMDLVDFSQERFDEIKQEYQKFATDFNFQSLVAIPISARFGDNVITRSTQSPWYDGPTLIDHLETVEVTGEQNKLPFRFPVQWVNRPNLDFRGYSGTVASGTVHPGDELVVSSSGKRSIVERIVTMDGDLPEAHAGEAVTITLADEIDISRGDMLASAANRPDVADQFAAHLIWMSDHEMLPGRSYILKMGTRSQTASVSEIKYKVDINSFEHLATKTLELNEVGFCNLSLSEPVAFDPYENDRQTGSFILVDRLSNETVAAGLVNFALRRATNIHWQSLQIDKQTRTENKGQNPAVLWFTGLSGSGKSTIATLLEKKLHLLGRHTYVLDGDNVRHGLNRDLGFTDVDRVENIRRVAEVSKLFVDAGLITLVSFISPFRSERRMAREMLENDEFVEIFIDTPIEECKRRDPKGLYQKAEQGLIKNFTGIDSPYEEPENPDIHIRTLGQDPEDIVNNLIRQLEEMKILPQ